MMRSTQLHGTPKNFEDMLARVCEDLAGTGLKNVAGRVLKVELFKQQLLIGDVLRLMRRVHGISEQEHIGVFWSWDEALTLPEYQLLVMCDQFRAEALSSACSKTWLLLTIASSISRSVDPTGAPPRIRNPHQLQRFLLVPMHPLYLKDMLWLVHQAWKAIRPERESWELHESVRNWLALVEGNPRLLECLLAAASDSPVWHQVNCERLDNFLSKGVTNEAAAAVVLERLMTLVKNAGVLTSDALETARTTNGSEWLLNLLGRYLLGTVVYGNDKMTGLELSYSKGQDMGVFSLRLVADCSSMLEDPDSSRIELQDPEYVRGIVHMPAIIVYQLCRQALSSEQFTHYQPLLHQWTGQLPSLLIQSRTREYVDPGAVALKLDFLRVIEKKTIVTLGQVLPLGAARDNVAYLRVETDHDWLPFTARHQQLKQEATNPAAPAVVVGQGTAAEADSLMRLKLADEPGHFVLWFQSEFHEACHRKERANLQEEYDKALAKDVPPQRQLFVLSTDAAEVSLEGLQVNTTVITVICADQHAAFYSSAGVMFRELISQVVCFTERTMLEVAAGRAQGPDATPAEARHYQSQMLRMTNRGLLAYARNEGIFDVAALGQTKADIARGIYERKRQRTQSLIKG